MQSITIHIMTDAQLSAKENMVKCQIA